MACNAATRIHLATSQLETAMESLRSMLEPPCAGEAALRQENARLLALLRSHPPPRPTMLPQRRLRIAARQEWKCAGCNEILLECFVIDHKRCWAEYFDDTDQNLQALCNPCNAAKTSHENSVRNRAR